MKITKRIPLEQYAYEELEFTNIEDYEKNYPIYVETFKRVKKVIEKANQPKEPFPSDNVTLTKEEENNLPN